MRYASVSLDGSTLRKLSHSPRSTGDNQSIPPMRVKCQSAKKIALESVGVLFVRLARQECSNGAEKYPGYALQESRSACSFSRLRRKASTRNGAPNCNTSQA